MESCKQKCKVKGALYIEESETIQIKKKSKHIFTVQNNFTIINKYTLYINHKIKLQKFKFFFFSSMTS